MKQTARQRNILFMWKQVLNCSNSKPVDYQVVESYLGFVVATSKVKEYDLETAIRFANNNRRSNNTLIEISCNGNVVASQESCFNQFVMRSVN